MGVGSSAALFSVKNPILTGTVAISSHTSSLIQAVCANTKNITMIEFLIYKLYLFNGKWAILLKCECSVLFLMLR